MFMELSQPGKGKDGGRTFIWNPEASSKGRAGPVLSAFGMASFLRAGY